MTDYALGILFGWLLLTVFRQRRHVRSLRRQLGPETVDAWTLRCECCARRCRSGHVLLCIVEYAPTCDRPAHRRVRAWHADRPKCSVAFATDPTVMETYLNGSTP